LAAARYAAAGVGDPSAALTFGGNTTNPVSRTDKWSGSA